MLLASQLPPSFWHCSSAFFAAVTSPAKAGTVKASARVRANIEMRVFMTFSPLRWLLEPVRRMLFGDIRSDGHRSRGPPGHQASGNPGREGRGFLRMKLVRRISGNTHSNGLGSHLIVRASRSGWMSRIAHPWRLSPAPLNREGGRWSYSRRKLNGGFISFASGEWL